jgi:hypothetical protein
MPTNCSDYSPGPRFSVALLDVGEDSRGNVGNQNHSQIGDNSNGNYMVSLGKYAILVSQLLGYTYKQQVLVRVANDTRNIK